MAPNPAARPASNTPGPLKGASNTSAGSTPILPNHGQAQPVTSGPRKVLLFLSYVFGPLYINNKLLQDYFASWGFSVLGPDYFFGAYFQDLPADTDKAEWGYNAKDKAFGVFPAWIDAVKAKYGTENTKYTAVGYCFGAPFVFDLAEKEVIVVGNVSSSILSPFFPQLRCRCDRPSLDESHFEKMTRPLLLSCSEDVITFPLSSRRRSEDILVRTKSNYYFQVFSGVAHGFAVRGNPEVPDERWAKEESARGIEDWFLRFSA